MNINRVGLGTFPLAGVFSKVSKREAENIVRLFIKDGGYYIDTAPFYGFGKVESLLGKVLKEFKRSDFSIISKSGFVDVEKYNTKESLRKSNSYKDVVGEFNRSLERLKLDYIDIYMPHFVDSNTPIEETMKALTDLKKSGRIKHIGVSNVSDCDLEEYCRYGDVEYVQNRYSLINNSLSPELLTLMQRKKIKLIPYQVIERGLLTHRAVLGIKIRRNDFRNTKPEWKIEKRNFITNWVKDNFYSIAKEENVDIENLVIAHALSIPVTAFPIVGASSTEQVLVNLKSDKEKVSRKTVNTIDKLFNQLTKKIRDEYDQDVFEFMGLENKYYHPSGKI